MDPPAAADIECLLDYSAKTGESPTWSVREQALYWIDIEQPALHRFDPGTGQDSHWMLPAEVGAFALRADGSGAILGLRTGLYELLFATKALGCLATAPFDPMVFRFNEGACDAGGRFWLGTMFDPYPNSAAADSAKKGAWHSYRPDEGLVVHADVAEIPNGLAWDADSRTMYISHSKDRTIYAFEFDVTAGRLGRRRVFATIPAELGVPDGGTVDADGCYWSALHGGARLRRFRADGSWERDVMLPVSHPTMCAFGGVALDMLYVTSASGKLTPTQRRREPLAGRLLRFRAGVCGRAPATFAAALASSQ